MLQESTIASRQQLVNSARQNPTSASYSKPNERYGALGTNAKTSEAEFYPALSATLTNGDLSRTNTQKSAGGKNTNNNLQLQKDSPVRQNSKNNSKYQLLREKRKESYNKIVKNYSPENQTVFDINLSKT